MGAVALAILLEDVGDPAQEQVADEFRGPGGRRIPLRRLRGSAAKALSELRPDLLILGSRGVDGLRSLGSVSERVAHESKASVLVVR
jgi:nucleotide-binding universal stress UspA family protein